MSQGQYLADQKRADRGIIKFSTETERPWTSRRNTAASVSRDDLSRMNKRTVRILVADAVLQNRNPSDDQRRRRRERKPEERVRGREAAKWLNAAEKTRLGKNPNKTRCKKNFHATNNRKARVKKLEQAFQLGITNLAGSLFSRVPVRVPAPAARLSPAALRELRSADRGRATRTCAQAGSQHEDVQQANPRRTSRKSVVKAGPPSFDKRLHGPPRQSSLAVVAEGLLRE